ncbi:hypothetical protein [Empedobacter brevis]|uniref:hypothetical protein n=1 Tax=Empedobacter brevis TaxID=247 RepID=UPI00289AD25F|nr:hypothetical protein [Empedobacter brevis]
MEQIAQLYTNLAYMGGSGMSSGLTMFSSKAGRFAIKGVDDIITNPSLLEGRTLAEVQKALKNPSGWKAGTMKQGNSSGKGWTLRQLNPRGTDYTDLYIQYHPGTPRHFNGNPYWKVSSGKKGPKRYQAK